MLSSSLYAILTLSLKDEISSETIRLWLHEWLWTEEIIIFKALYTVDIFRYNKFSIKFLIF